MVVLLGGSSNKERVCLFFQVKDEDGEVDEEQGVELTDVAIKKKSAVVDTDAAEKKNANEEEGEEEQEEQEEQEEEEEEGSKSE